MEDRATIQGRLSDYQPETSELTFTNLFIWRDYYRARWSMLNGNLLIVYKRPVEGLYALPPIGPAPRREVTREILLWLRQQGEKDPCITRADSRLVAELSPDEFDVEPMREHFDYVYRTAEMIQLSGRKLHAKRNYVNVFLKTYRFTYEDLTPALAPACLDLAARWCALRHCDEDMGLSGEREAIKEALSNLDALKIRGGLIRIDGNVEAFTLGEMLNARTAVIHIEKADPDIRGLYAIINQQFLEHAWRDVEFVNREQDLGEPTLRETKLSYQPERLLEKFRIRLKQ